ncbi:hypothetical protein [Sphingobium sp. TCM1]|uniref:hypothetical protein n=1 Tax=Sphingobium sp. TCM1 TaxID=453246 RepID=UPI000B2BAB2E|nr:hypothetical protein [Sphingobium sp. TCM1]
MIPGYSSAPIEALFSAAGIVLDERDTAGSREMRNRHGATAWFFLDEGWRCLRGAEPERHEKHWERGAMRNPHDP